jgi:hypothetical protein
MSEVHLPHPTKKWFARIQAILAWKDLESMKYTPVSYKIDMDNNH